MKVSIIFEATCGDRIDTFIRQVFQIRPWDGDCFFVFNDTTVRLTQKDTVDTAYQKWEQQRERKGASL